MIHDFAFEGDIVWCATTCGVIFLNKSDGKIMTFTTENGIPVASGVYISRLRLGEHVATKKMLFLR